MLSEDFEQDDNGYVSFSGPILFLAAIRETTEDLVTPNGLVNQIWNIVFLLNWHHANKA